MRHHLAMDGCMERNIRLLSGDERTRYYSCGGSRARQLSGIPFRIKHCVLVFFLLAKTLRVECHQHKICCREMRGHSTMVVLKAGKGKADVLISFQVRNTACWPYFYFAKTQHMERDTSQDVGADSLALCVLACTPYMLCVIYIKCSTARKKCLCLLYIS
mmetsp:Transcript_2099/g.4643  ORF Transcript_2099/g.4643 Transcript_2099/m.4643 type:complete len:160 (-) Transcript_2099:1843-2322(-)